MKTRVLDAIVENLFYILPLIHKKLLKIDPAKMSREISLSRLHIGILGAVYEEGTLPISEIAEKLLIRRPQMTLLIGQLVRAGMIERTTNPDDRRIANIKLTPRGESTLKNMEELLKDHMREKLSNLNERELEELSRLLLKLRRLGAKLNNSGK
ncbi:MAG: transcriptional regulator [Chloroflexi bacterium]|nr:transcriptional regulator [Chloroflexota bacterium]